MNVFDIFVKINGKRNLLDCCANIQMGFVETLVSVHSQEAVYVKRAGKQFAIFFSDRAQDRLKSGCGRSTASTSYTPSRIDA